jgi:hypothetical protein
VNRFRVRRLAVIDLHAYGGTALRRWFVRIEFFLAAIGCLVLGVFLCAHGGVVGWAVGLALLGIGANYMVLAAWAVVLWNPERLAREFGAHDVRADGSYISRARWRVAVPFLFLILALQSSERQI